MSKQGKRKITVELPKTKDLANRPSVFERLGTKKASKKTTEHCRQWAQHGSCAYGKGCKFAATHTLISPSKQRAANKDSEHKRLLKDDGKNRLHSTVVVRSGRSPDAEIDNWDQNDLEYADTDVLEKRRQQLQRELDLQMKMDSGKDLRKEKKAVTSSSSSRSSSSSSASSSSSDASSSSSSSERDARKKGKKSKLKRNSSSSSEGDIPSKKKYLKSESVKRDKTEIKKTALKRDDKTGKKCDIKKKKVLGKTTVVKKSLSPGKKSGGTPPITLKNAVKGYSVTKHGKSPARRDKNRSISPTLAKEREKERDRVKEREKEKDRDREKERDKERERNRPRSRSPRKARSRSPRRLASHSKDLRPKESSERSRPVSPKKQVRRDASAERHRKRSMSRERDRGRDHKDRSIERKKHDEKDRYDRKDRSDLRDRGRDRTKDVKREDVKRNRGRDRGLSRGGADKGLEKPNKPMERLLPRPEERLAALAAISNRALEADKSSTNSKDRQDGHSERSSRKQERSERDRSSKRERLDSIDRDHVDYDIGLERPYEHGPPMDYDRVDDRYDDGPRDDDRSPVYGMPSRERHYDPGYDIPGPPRNYPEDDERGYGEHIGDRVDIGYDDHRPRRDHSWERHSGSLDRERSYIHSHKEWDNDDYRGPPEWGRERHWAIHDPQMSEWADKDPEVEGWHHRGPPAVAHRSRIHDDYNRGIRSEHGRPDKRRARGPEPKESAPPPPPADHDDNPIPDDLSEISDDPDDILNRDDMIDQNDDDSQVAPTNVDEGTIKSDALENQSTQDTSGAGEEKESQEAKDDEDVTNLDFEEISDGELEEERTRAGLGDALGVDWASLVAEVRRREQPAPTTGARERWRPERVLAHLGLSLEMAGKEVVQNVLEKDYKTRLNEIEKSEQTNQDAENNKSKDQNGKLEEKLVELAPDVDTLHPVAAIQAAMEKRKQQRAALFGSGCDITRALCARRDLALRRHLCNLPPTERSGQSRVTPQPALFHAARALLMQEPVSG